MTLIVVVHDGIESMTHDSSLSIGHLCDLAVRFPQVSIAKEKTLECGFANSTAKEMFSSGQMIQNVFVIRFLDLPKDVTVKYMVARLLGRIKVMLPFKIIRPNKEETLGICEIVIYKPLPLTIEAWFDWIDALTKMFDQTVEGSPFDSIMVLIESLRPTVHLGETVKMDHLVPFLEEIDPDDESGFIDAIKKVKQNVYQV